MPKAFPEACRFALQFFIDWSGWTQPQSERTVFSGGIQNAWDAWASVIDVRGVITGIRANATGVIKFVPSDGKPGSLPVGTWASSSLCDGTCNQQPGQTYSNGVTWTRENAFKVGAHEIGHFLGLNHIADRNSIMSQWPNSDRPTEYDIQAAVAVGYSRRQPPPPKPGELTNAELTAALQAIRDTLNAALKP